MWSPDLPLTRSPFVTLVCNITSASTGLAYGQARFPWNVWMPELVRVLKELGNHPDIHHVSYVVDDGTWELHLHESASMQSLGPLIEATKQVFTGYEVDCAVRFGYANMN